MVAKKTLPSSDIKDFIPAAFQDDCLQPRSIQIDYHELPGGELEFSYTVKWRGTRLPIKMKEVCQVQTRLVKEEREEKTKVKKRVKAPKKEKEKSCDTQNSMDPTQQCLTTPVKTPISPADTVTDPLERLRSVLVKKFNCPRYIYSSSSSSKESLMSSSFLSLRQSPSPDDSARSYIDNDWNKKKNVYSSGQEKGRRRW